MAADPANSVTYFLTVPAAHRELLGPIRHWSNLKVGFEGERIWVTGFTSEQIGAREVKTIPYCSVYFAKGPKLFPQGSRLPARSIPSLLWTPIGRGLPVELPPFNHNYFGLAEKADIRLAATDAVRDAFALCTTLETLAGYVEKAPAVRLKPLSWAVLGAGRAIILGAPLLPVPGEALWRRGCFLLPAGLDFERPALEGPLAKLLNPDNKDWVDGNRTAGASGCPAEPTSPDNQFISENGKGMNAQKYFQSYEDYFWQWEDGGEAIAIPGGRTIAYREYLLQVLGLLQPQGMPRFGSLLLAVLATNSDAAADLLRATSRLKLRLSPLNTKYPLQVKEGERFLLELARLPEEYKKGRKRLQLFQFLFSDSHNRVSAKKGKAILEAFQDRREAMDEFSRKRDLNPDIVIIDFRPFFLLWEKYPTAEAILQGMASLPAAEEEVLSPEENPEPGAVPGDFVQELLEDLRTFQVGALIPRIWSGLYIPAHHRVPAGQPFGGVSGMSNKGDLHRLLISELANDDIVFLSRLANNEALYLNREAPPQADGRERVLLIDVSVKSWGTPRIAAFALMLSIARHPKNDIPCTAFAIGNDCYPLAFDSKHDIIEGLQLMEACLHPAPGLERFFQEYPDKQEAEIVLITPEETLRLPAMQQAMEAQHAFIDYWIQADSRGKITLFKKQQQGRKHLKTMQLPLGELWKKKAPKPKKEKREAVPDPEEQ